MKLTALSIVLSMLFLPLIAVSQVNITTIPGTYTQNFAFLGTGNFVLTDNATPGWYSFRTAGNVAGGNAFNADNGTGFLGGFNNYGTNADRALGSIASLPGIVDTGTMYYGLRIHNSTASPFQSVRVQYTGEQWRALSVVPQTLAFSYQVSAAPITSLVGSFTPVTALDFTTPVNAFLGSLDGNLAANRTAKDSTFIVSIPAGSEIMLRWQDTPDDVLLNHGFGIDDVTITLTTLGPTAAPVSITGRVTTANGAGIAGAVLVLSGGQLEQPVVVRTNSFGYFRVDAPAGATYLLEINSKRYSFPQSSQVIHAQDNVTDVNFIAE